MAIYVNCGARVNGVRPTTKKALKDALRMVPLSVTFDATSGFDGRGGLGHCPDMGTVFSVVGPCPFTKRAWYASVTADSDGRLTVK